MAVQITTAQFYVPRHEKFITEQFIPFNQDEHEFYRRFTITDGIATEDHSRFDPNKDYNGYFILYQADHADF